MSLAIRFQVFKAYVAFPWLTAVVVSLLQTPMFSPLRAVLDTDEKSSRFPIFSCAVVFLCWSAQVFMLERVLEPSEHLSLRYDALAPICADCCKGDALLFFLSLHF